MGYTVRRSSIESSECAYTTPPPPLDGPLVTETLTEPSLRYSPISVL